MEQSKKYMGSRPAIGKERALAGQRERETRKALKHLAVLIAMREGLTTLEDGRELGEEELQEALDGLQQYVFRVSRETSE